MTPSRLPEATQHVVAESVRRASAAVVITEKRGDLPTPLPEGAGYPGFIFARGNEPGQIEQVLRKAHGLLRIRIKEVLAT